MVILNRVAVFGVVVAFAIGCGSSSPTPALDTLLITAIGVPNGTPVQQTIDAAGGIVASSDGRLIISIPPGALATPTPISIQPITNETPGGAGDAYRLGPEGQTFAAPVTLTFSHSPGDLGGNSPGRLRIAYQDAARSWVSVQGLVRDDVQGTIVAETTHFSDWSQLLGSKLLPGSASLRHGATQQLEVQLCEEHPLLCNSGSESDCRYYCYPQDVGGTLLDNRTWKVNGIERGDLALGIVDESSSGTGVYTAPLATPSSNPVAVSVEGICSACDDGASTDLLILVSNITVGELEYSGTINSTLVQDFGGGQTGTTTIVANAAFRYDPTEQVYKSFQGTLNATYSNVSPTCGFSVTYAGAIAPDEGVILVYEDTSSYTPYGAQPYAAYDGTTTCNSSGMPEPLTIMMGVPWWSVPGGAQYMMRKPDNRLEEHLMGVQTGLGIGDIQWSLTPMAN